MSCCWDLSGICFRERKINYNFNFLFFFSILSKKSLIKMYRFQSISSIPYVSNNCSDWLWLIGIFIIFPHIPSQQWWNKIIDERKRAIFEIQIYEGVKLTVSVMFKMKKIKFNCNWLEGVSISARVILLFAF